MPDVRPLRPGDPERIGAHRLVGVLGSGGQGTVYKAVADGGREVAIKVLHSHLSGDDDITKSFLREVEAARRVAAFCTAAVLDVGMSDDRPYIVSEYVAGDTLHQVVRSAGPRAGGALDRLAISTLTALAAIHQAGIVHRDFKPGNVLMGPEGPVVIDFGIAKALDATTIASGPVGTPAYMSPEQFEGGRIGPASDVFSWAGTMVFAATGRPPFAGDSVPAIMNAILSGAADLSGVPPHLLDPIRECLSKDPAARPMPADLMQRLIRRPAPSLQPPPASPPPPPSPSPGPQPAFPGPRPGSPGPEPGPAVRPGAGASSGPVNPPSDAAPSRSAGGPAAGPAGGPAAGSAGGPAAGPAGGPASGPHGRPPGFHPGQAFRPNPAGDAETSPSGGRRVSRRAVISAVAAAAATAGISAFAILRPKGTSARPQGDPSSSPSADAAASATSATSPPPQRTATPSPSAEPFGTRIGKPVPLPAGSGSPAALASNGSAVACGTANGTVLAWDLSTAAVTKLGDGGGGATSVAYGLFNGDTVVASGHSDGRMRLWSSSGRSLATRRAGDPIVAVTVMGQAAIAVSQKYDGMKDYRGTVRLWNIATGKQIGATGTEHWQGIRGLAFGWIGDDDVLVTGDGDQTVRVRRLSTGAVTHSFNTGRIGGIELLACGTSRGKPILVSTHLDATLRVYDLATGKRRKKWTFSDQSPDDRGVTALTAGQLGDVPIAAVAHAPWGGAVIVRVWNLDNGEIIGVLGPGEGGAIRTLALAELGGRPVVVGTGEDRLLRVWSLGPA